MPQTGVFKQSLGETGLLPESNRLKLPLKEVHESTTYCYTSEEVAAMDHRCRSEPELRWLADVIVALSRTGLRISELTSLRWSDVDFERNVITLTNNAAGKRRAGERRQTKNRRDRTLPIHRELVAVLKSLAACRSTRGQVFHGPRGGKLKADTVRNVLFRDVIKPLADRFPSDDDEIGFKNGRLHSFRHYFCSIAAASGVPEATVKMWLGHRSSEMVRRYFHLHDRVAQQQMKLIGFTADDCGDVAAKSPAKAKEVPESGQVQ